MLTGLGIGSELHQTSSWLLCRHALCVLSASVWLDSYCKASGGMQICWHSQAMPRANEPSVFHSQAGLLEADGQMLDAGEKITPDDVWERMEDDVQAADLILWVGISFEQSASTMYFRRVRQFLAQAERLTSTPQAIINLSDESLWNLLSACSNTRMPSYICSLSPPVGMLLCPSWSCCSFSPPLCRTLSLAC